MIPFTSAHRKLPLPGFEVFKFTLSCTQVFQVRNNDKMYHVSWFAFLALKLLTGKQRVMRLCFWMLTHGLTKVEHKFALTSYFHKPLFKKYFAFHSKWNEKLTPWKNQSEDWQKKQTRLSFYCSCLCCQWPQIWWKAGWIWRMIYIYICIYLITLQFFSLQR